MRHTSKIPDTSVFSLPCACANLRRAARAVTRLYDRELAGTGLEAAQFTIVMALVKTGEISQGHLGRLLALDSTTLSRSLKPLLRDGWIRSRPGDDRRERLVDVTPEGRQRFKKLLPKWENAQEKLKTLLKNDGWDRMQTTVTEVTNAALKS